MKESYLKIELSKESFIEIFYDTNKKQLLLSNVGKVTVLQAFEKLIKELNIHVEKKVERYIPLNIVTTDGHKFYTVYDKGGLIEEHLDNNHISYSCYKFFSKFSQLLSRRYFDNV